MIEIGAATVISETLHDSARLDLNLRTDFLKLFHYFLHQLQPAVLYINATQCRCGIMGEA
jgi:hypothetical protein